jgi:hypothetical protein
MTVRYTPTLGETINQLIDAKLVNIHTSIPAIVEAYNAQNKTVDVIPAIKRKRITGEIETIQRINNVPIAYYQSENAIFSFPLQKGDSVQLIFNERSIDKWRKSGGLVFPDDIRKFDLSDAVAYPTLKYNGSGLEADSDHLMIKNGNSQIRLSNGSVEIKGTSDELVDLCNQLATACSQILTNTQIGPQAPTNVSTFTSLATKFSNLKI